MSERTYSDEFLAAAIHHFVAMAFVTTMPNGEVLPEMRSCFVAEIEGEWLLVTAGHVIRTLRGYAALGRTLSHFELHDKWSGRRFAPYDGVLFHFDPAECLFFDQADADYAAWLLDDMTIRGLRAGGVRPIEEVAWRARMPAAYNALLLVGLPKETLVQRGSRMDAAPTLIPLELVDAPTLLEKPLHPDVFVARLLQSDQPVVENVDGMSGGPIFGVWREDSGVVKYQLVGVQSGWLRPSRRVTFYATLPFFNAVAEYFRKRNAGD